MLTREERFWAKVEKTDTCWLWTGAKIPGGYGSFHVGDRRVLAHRYAYELLIGAIPAGLKIDHLCRERLCVRPAHLDPVSDRTNILRGVGRSAVNATVVRCPAGHAYDETNTYTDSKRRRHCRECNREAQRQYRLRRASA